MKEQKVRVRFAPSPTGYLHIGSLRTIIFNYLTAKSCNGKIILRIEDTDQKRKVDDAIDKLFDILQWLGIDFNEGPHIGGDYGPYIQSQRSEIYKQKIDQLLETGHAYRCFCTQERLEEMREEQKRKGLAPRYDGRCCSLNEEEVRKRVEQGEKFVVRQRIPDQKEITVEDKLRGKITFDTKEIEDHILFKSDGTPTYQLASVVDDHLMEISHVIRGEEWIPSFPKNILLYQAFGWRAPEFVHIPLTLNQNGAKLSKRHGDVTVEAYKDKGYLPEALVNFCALLGWHPQGDEEIVSLDQMIKQFRIQDMKISPAIFDINKLDHLNGYYIRQKDIHELTDLCLPYLKKNFTDETEEYKKEKDFLKKVVALEQQRLKNLSEISELTAFFFKKIPEYDTQLLVWKKITLEEAGNNLERLYELLSSIKNTEWNQENIESKTVGFIKDNNLGVGDFLWPMRVALTGKQHSPGPFETSEVLGREESLKRIEYAINKIKKG
jgi:glutamyl-tRNA synthetase